ncbi:hypothetical protein EHM76_05365 [bacterium]|nr:MAG: hypothetical protein EHM76_05365 [bacterium]
MIRKIGFQDFDGDGYQELIFAISTGYRKQPRNCYIFNIARNKLITSPESGASIIQAELFDMTGDSLPEIVCSSFAPGNMDSLFPYSDQQGWLMVYDKNLKFVFQPVKFEKHPCQVTAIPFKSGNVNRIATLNHYFGPDTISSTLGIFDSSGACLRQLKLPPSNNTYSLFAADHNSFYLLGAKSSEIELRDTAFNVLRRIESPEFNDNTVLKILDADDDGSDEYFFKGNRTGSYYLARSDFSTITSINVGIDYAIFSPFISMIHKGDQHPEIYLPVEQVGILLNYSRNPLFSFRFLVYCVVYITLSALLYVVYVMQRYLARIQYETKRRMNELQLKSIRNQIDPHFTFNVLNSIGSLYSQSENRKTADFLFGKYARLLRETIITSDQTEVTLEHELEFVGNYLDIEKFRQDNGFIYNIETGSNVDTGIKIPRMLIHTFAENAVKYAIRQVESDARLDISVKKSDARLYITLTDNGPGLKGTRKTEVTGTGKGLALVDEMARLYFDMTGVRISYSLEEVIENGVCTGTRAEITFNLKM